MVDNVCMVKSNAYNISVIENMAIDTHAAHNTRAQLLELMIKCIDISPTLKANKRIKMIYVTDETFNY